VKPKPAQEHWYRVAICLHEFGQRLVGSSPPDFRNLLGHRCKAPPPQQGG